MVRKLKNKKEGCSMESIGQWWSERGPVTKGLILGSLVAGGAVLVMGIGAVAAARVMKNNPGMEETSPSESEGEVLEIPYASEEA